MLISFIIIIIFIFIFRCIPPSHNGHWQILLFFFSWTMKNKMSFFIIFHISLFTTFSPKHSYKVQTQSWVISIRAMRPSNQPHWILTHHWKNFISAMKVCLWPHSHFVEKNKKKVEYHRWPSWTQRREKTSQRTTIVQRMEILSLYSAVNP